MDRASYFIRRLLLIIPTFIGITFLCFGICQAVPGGPVEQMMIKMRSGIRGQGENQGAMSGVSIGEEQRKVIERHFGFDLPLHKRYWKWLVTDRMGMAVKSYKYPNKTVWEMVSSRFPVSLVFGLTGFLLTYAVCIPLGIAKALRHGSRFDLVSSVVVFAGYATPTFAMGLLLRTALCGVREGWPDIFPAFGFQSADFAQLSFAGKAQDVFMHMFLPVGCYVIGSFAVLTLLMKNSLLDQISQDYVRTVIAKGGSLKRAIWMHAFRNSLIPIATGIGGILTVMFAGSVLIEKVFEIPGMGLLSLEAIIGRDYMLFMGITALTAVLGLLGRLLSDFAYLLIDPRMDFNA